MFERKKTEKKWTVPQKMKMPPIILAKGTNCPPLIKPKDAVLAG